MCMYIHVCVCVKRWGVVQGGKNETEARRGANEGLGSELPLPQRRAREPSTVAIRSRISQIPNLETGQQTRASSFLYLCVCISSCRRC